MSRTDTNHGIAIVDGDIAAIDADDVALVQVFQYT